MSALTDSAIGIPIGGEKIVLVDAQHVRLVLSHPWLAEKDGNTHYARASIYHGRYDWRRKSLHRLILGAKAGQIVDHINGDGLDNRLANLRLCSSRQNVAHSIHLKLGRTNTRGVHVVKKTGRYCARICVYGRRIHLGSYKTAEEAGRAYDAAALRLNGQFAVLNTPEHMETETRR